MASSGKSGDDQIRTSGRESDTTSVVDNGDGTKTVTRDVVDFSRSDRNPNAAPVEVAGLAPMKLPVADVSSNAAPLGGGTGGVRRIT